MDLPFTPKFFKKLELYQELRRLNKRDGERMHWVLEKILLEWAHHEHFQVGQYLTTNQIYELLRERCDITDDEIGAQAPHVVQNLEHHGWGIPPERDRNMIKISRDGMLMGQVIVESATWRNPLYRLSGYIVWLVFILAFAALFFGAINQTSGFFASIIPTASVSTQVDRERLLIRQLKQLTEISEQADEASDKYWSLYKDMPRAQKTPGKYAAKLINHVAQLRALKTDKELQGIKDNLIVGIRYEARLINMIAFTRGEYSVQQRAPYAYKRAEAIATARQLARDFISEHKLSKDASFASWSP